MKKDIFKIIMTIFAIVLIVAVIANIYALTVTPTPTYQLLTSVGLIITGLFGAIYLMSGYSKQKSSLYFVCFMILYAITEWMGIIGAKSNNTVNMMLLVLSFGFSCVLAISKDLGKFKSVILSSVIVLTVVGRLVISYYTTGLPVFGVRPLTKLIIGLTVLVLVIAKYHDKKQRGTK